MPVLDTGIHELSSKAGKAWMAGSSPTMTTLCVRFSHRLSGFLWGADADDGASQVVCAYAQVAPRRCAVPSVPKVPRALPSPIWGWVNRPVTSAPAISSPVT